MSCNDCGTGTNSPVVEAPKDGVTVPVKVSNHMIPAILTTIFCCLVGGIVSIIYASKVNTRLAQGDIAGAQSASKTALGWIIANVVIGAIFPFFILMGSLIPAISSSMTSANTSAAAMRGRNLFVAIELANVERGAAGLPGVWPRTAGSFLLNRAAQDDISGMAFDNAADYFKVLFDMKAYGTDRWEPYVNVDKGVLKLPGSDDGFCDWIVAANVLDELEDSVPVLISANVDPATLKASYDGDDNTPIPFGSKVGRKVFPWGDAAVVVVRKGGGAQVIKAKHFNYNVLYNRQGFSAPGLKYLDAR